MTVLFAASLLATAVPVLLAGPASSKADGVTS